MRFIADLHIHSHFSIATSRFLTPEHLEYWARIKGISVLGTGDCIHPGWLQELREKLEPADNGFFTLKESYRLRESRELSHEMIPPKVFFLLTGELSSIYSKGGRVRKVHSLCLFPDFDAAVSLQEKLDMIGNIRSDGRPILGLDCYDILRMMLESDERSMLIPAHIWTPWFSVLGSKSGFDSMEECFGDLTGHITAVETGLSSDPAMNRSCSFLDRFTLVSNSDAHSPEKLGREANLFDTEMSYEAIRTALHGGGGLVTTIEFFPQEGKYHFDGHRKCGIRWDPLETERHQGICPVCGKEVTKGVLYRVAELADRMQDETSGPFYSITQLPDLIAEMQGQKSGGSKKVRNEFHRLIRSLGPEFHILLNAEIAELYDAGGPLLAEGIRRLRCGEVRVSEGYDGEFGRVRVFDKDEMAGYSGTSLFASGDGCGPRHGRKMSLEFDIDEFRRLKRGGSETAPRPAAESGAGQTDSPLSVTFTDEQKLAVAHDGPCMVIAGPGAGKTRVLVERISHLVARGVPPERILAMTFSNRAARELKERLSPGYEDDVYVSTIHGFGLNVLKEQHELFGRTADFRIIDDEERLSIMKDIAGNDRQAAQALRTAEMYKCGAVVAGDTDESFNAYEKLLKERNLFDLPDLVAKPAALFEKEEAVAAACRRRYAALLIDEFQDIDAAQYRLIRSLAGDGAPNLFVIGDPDQAIYGFRGASPRFFDSLRAGIPDMKLYTLSRSFRCPDPVLKTARQVLQGPVSFSGIPSNVKIEINSAESGRSEADWIASRIEAFMGGVRSFSRDSGISDGEAARRDASFSDFALLCRASFQFDDITEALRNHGIPYQVVDNNPFYAKQPYRAAVEKFKACLFENTDESVSALVRDGADTTLILEKLLLEEGANPLEIKRMSALAVKYGAGYHEFLRTLALRRGGDDFLADAASVAVMTLHASKGLEFDTVFIPGCEDGLIPFTLFSEKEDSLLREEERLLYVGMTRSKRLLYISHARHREYRGRVLRLSPSPYLDRIEKELINFKEREGERKKTDDQLTLF